MKILMTTFALVSAIGISGLAIADEQITLPAIAKPSVLEEGTQRQLTAVQIAELMPWAKNSKMFLNDLLDNIQALSMQDKVERLIEGIKTVVIDSNPKNSELFIRYTLNRGLILSEVLSNEMNSDSVGTIDVKYRVLTATVKMAIKYYDTDMEVLTKNTKAPYVAFGIDYFDFLNELNKSVFDASAQYAIQRIALEWIQWDLYRDLNNVTFAPQILKINNALKIYPTKKLTDSQSIAYIRQMKSLAGQLNISNVDIESRKREKDLEILRISTERNQKLALKIGSRVYYMINNSSAKREAAVVVALQSDGLYTIKYPSDGKIYSNLQRDDLAVTDSCGELFCTGEIAYNTDRKFVKVQIVGVTTENKYILLYLEGENLKGAIGGSWSDEYLAKISGCNSKEKVCVGDKMINTKLSTPVTIYGLMKDDKYAIKFTDGSYSGQISQGWSLSQLVKDL